MFTSKISVVFFVWAFVCMFPRASLAENSVQLSLAETTVQDFCESSVVHAERGPNDVEPLTIQLADRIYTLHCAPGIYEVKRARGVMFDSMARPARVFLAGVAFGLLCSFILFMSRRKESLVDGHGD